MKKAFGLLVVMALVLTFSLATFAVANMIANPGFEEDTLGGGVNWWISDYAGTACIKY